MLIRVNEAEVSNDFIEYIQLAESYGKVQLELFVEDVEEDSAYNVSDFYMDEETVEKLIKALQSFKKGGN